jgi:hypothetical protein
MQSSKRKRELYILAWHNLKEMLSKKRGKRVRLRKVCMVYHHVNEKREICMS